MASALFPSSDPGGLSPYICSITRAWLPIRKVLEPGLKPVACHNTQATSQEVACIQQSTQCPTSWVMEWLHCPQHGLTPSEFGPSPDEAEPSPSPALLLTRRYQTVGHTSNCQSPSPPPSTLTQKPWFSVSPLRAIYRTPTTCLTTSSRLGSTESKKDMLALTEVTSHGGEGRRGH